MASAIVLNADKPIGPNGLKGNISTDKNVTGTKGDESANQELFQLLNAARNSAGVASLKRCSPLDQAAADHVFDMNLFQYFDHYNLKQESPLKRVQATGYQLQAKPILVSEVIAWDRNTPQIALDSWMASPDNKAVLSDRTFVDVGIASYRGASLAYLRNGIENWNSVWFWCIVLAVGGMCEGNSMYSSIGSAPQPYAVSGPICFSDSDGFNACFDPAKMV
jgi:uncharacterized protein YkwD